MKRAICIFGILCLCGIQVAFLFFARWILNREISGTAIIEITKVRVDNDTFDLSNLSGLCDLIENIFGVELNNFGFLGNPKMKIVITYEYKITLSDLSKLKTQYANGEQTEQGQIIEITTEHVLIISGAHSVEILFNLTAG
jgi:hypothetical protein